MTREEQIKMASEIIAHGCSDELEAALIQDFPELKESEDEKIRKFIYGIILNQKKIVKNLVDNVDELCKINKALDWLEEHKEQKQSISCGHENDIEWNEEDEVWLHCFEHLWEENFKKDASDIDAYMSGKRWLKSLRPQLKREDWTMEDSINITKVKTILEQAVGKTISEERWRDLTIWLDEHFNAYPLPKKLLPHWKPTEEQMKKLNIAIACYEGDWGEDDAKPLRELFEQLKIL